MPTRPWREIRAEKSKASPERRAAIDGQVREDVARMHLPEIRRAREMTQQTLAQTLEIAQGDVSKLERRTDAYVSTLRNYIEAMGGTLRIVAEFPEADPIEIVGFGAISESPVPTAAIAGKRAAARKG